MKCNIHRFGTANICLDCGYIKDYNPVPKEDEERVQIKKEPRFVNRLKSSSSGKQDKITQYVRELRDGTWKLAKQKTKTEEEAKKYLIDNYNDLIKEYLNKKGD